MKRIVFVLLCVVTVVQLAALPCAAQADELSIAAAGGETKAVVTNGESEPDEKSNGDTKIAVIIAAVFAILATASVAAVTLKKKKNKIR